MPVAVHTGDTAFSDARLKYAHPLTVDEAAADFPDVKFVICHCGNPWFADATEVAAKNPNVYIDLSGLLEAYPGRIFITSRRPILIIFPCGLIIWPLG